MGEPLARVDEVPSYKTFLAHFLLPNKPVIIGPSLIASWPAYKHWQCEDGSINWDTLQSGYGDLEVTVADCSTHEFSDQHREQMLFRDIVALWKEGKGRALYVKDWHLARRLTTNQITGMASREAFYATPDIFRDDWMNAYYSAHTQDDFRFVYVGAAETFTPLHRDVYTSYSWSTNVAGRKRWWLFPPDQTPFLFRKGGEEHLETVFDVRDVDLELYPLFERARPIVVEQGSGETIFVQVFVLPSGWYHQVENITDCISINHNWCNAVNLPSLYDSMCDKVLEVERALEDVRELLAQGSAEPEGWHQEWTAIVQDVVEKDAGWNWLTFWKMVRHALTLAEAKPCIVNEDLWPRTSTDLTPPLDFIVGRIRRCYEDFLVRSQREHILVSELGNVLIDVKSMLNE
ncbi:Clavaminate synthase-like protein [Trametes maxima]|nr:Clavaminate synthase-like protein [Trametes maxima]